MLKLQTINLLADAGVTAANTLYTVLFCAVAVAVVLLTIWLLTRYMGKSKNLLAVGDGGETVEKPKIINFTALLLVVLAIGLIVRLIFTFLSFGYLPAYNTITNLFERLELYGFGGAYYSDGGTVFPLTYYVYALMGALANAFGLTVSSIAMPFFVKLPLLAADLLTALLLYKVAKKYINSYVGLIVAAFYCIFPLFVFASAIWGSVYSLLTLFLVATLYFVTQKNYMAATGLYGAALLISKEAIYLFPLMAVYLIYNFVKAVLYVKKEQVSGNSIVKNKDSRAVVEIPCSIVAVGILLYVLTLPVMMGSYGASYFGFLYHFFLYPLVDLKSFGTNSLSIFNLFMKNGVGLDARFPSVVFAIIFGVIITAIVLLVYLSKKNRANLVFLSAYILFTLATYFIGFNEMSLLPVFGLLLLAFLLIRDKRLLQIFGVLGVAVLLNGCIVMATAGYFTNADMNQITITAPVASDLILTGASGVATTIICSVLAILSHLYATLVLLDISMSNKRKLLPEIESASFGKSMAGWFKR